MAENTATPVTAISPVAARLSFAAAAAFLVLLAALHLDKPELDPSWRMISEYEIGRHGWIMRLAFLALASSCVTLFVAIRSQAQTTGGRIGMAFLLLSAAGMAVAAVFIADPITASQDELTAHGNLHALGAFLGIPASRRRHAHRPKPIPEPGLVSGAAIASIGDRAKLDRPPGAGPVPSCDAAAGRRVRAGRAHRMAQPALCRSQ